MKIQETYSTFQFVGVKKENTINNLQKECYSSEQVRESVQIEISEEGYKNYRESVQKNLEGCDRQEQIDIEWLNDYVEKNAIKIHPYTELMHQLDVVVKEDELKTAEDVANAVFKIYTAMYDKICKEYEEGTRRSWVKEVKAGEVCYRKETKEEELATLNDAYEKAAKSVERYFEIERPRIEKLKEDMWKSEALTVWEKEHRVLERPKREIDRSRLKSENIYTSMMNAGRTFRRGYSINENQKEFLERVAGIAKNFYNPVVI